MLCGRETELARIAAVLDDARQLRSRSLVLRGEPGIGKTALLEAAGQRAQGFRVLHTLGTDLESEIPFAGLFDLVRPRPVLEIVGQLPPAQRSALRTALGLDGAASGPAAVESAPAGRFAICTGTLALLSAVAEQQPLLVVVDDAQWLDDASAEALLFAARRLHLDAVAFLWAVREGASTAGALDEFDTLRLGALDERAAQRLIEERLGRSVAPHVLRHLVAATNGNPLTLVEAVRTLSDQQLVGSDRIPLSLPLGTSAVALFQDRIDALDDSALTALTLLSLDSTGEPALLQRAAAALGVDYGRALRQLEADFLVRIELGQPALAHPLVRAALSRRLAPSAERAAHRALADTLRGRADPTACAWHLAAAATEPDESVAETLDRAARVAARRGAYATASLARERAARLTPRDSRRAELLLAAAEDARHAGRPADATRLLADAATCAEHPVMQSHIECERARIELYHGGAREARRLLEAAAELVRSTDPRAAASLLGQAAFAALIAGEELRGARLAQSAHSIGEQEGGQRDAIVELTLGLALLHQGDAPRSLAVLRDAAQLTEQTRDEVDPDYLAFAALALTWVGEFAQAREMLTRLLAQARAEAAAGLLCSLLYAAAYLEARTGNLLAAYSLANEGVDVARATSNDLWGYLSLCALAYAEAAQGREADCREHARAALEMSHRLQLDYPASLLDALGLLELGLGRVEQAVVHLAAANSRPGSSEPTYSRPSAPDLVEAYLRAGLPLPAGLSSSLEVVSEQQSHPNAAALAWRCRGLAAPEDDVDRCFANALRLHAVVDNPFALARTELCYGERLRRAGRRVHARGHLVRAHEMFTGLGATPWVARADAELRAAGGQGQDTGRVGLEALTPQELQVAFTIAKGVTNRQAGATLYLSPKTIEFHLGQIYRKLGISSRMELAAQVARLQAPLTAAAAPP